MDVVTEKDSHVQHDFETDPVLLHRILQHAKHGDCLTAQGTTLGADNGIGVAAILALLEIKPSAQHPLLPPIQALFTVDEEIGLTGCLQLDAQALGLTGKTMVNLDSEEWGDLYVGCAGIGVSRLALPLTRHGSTAIRRGEERVEIKVHGLVGGHSGCNIHEGRASAI